MGPSSNTPRSVTVTTPFGLLHGTAHPSGAPHAVAPVVVWPSLFSTAAVQVDLVRRLAARSPVLAIDPPGHGRSRLDEADALTMGTAARATLDLLDVAGTAFAEAAVRWVGTSWGGLVGVEVAVSHAHRLEHLACLNTPFLHRRSTTTAILPLLARTLGTTSLFAAMTARTFFLPATRRAGAEPMEAHRRTFTRGDRRQLSAAAHLVFGRRSDALPVLPQVRVPTLVVAGTRDAMYPIAQQRAAAERLPRGTLVEIEGAHIVAVDAPDAVADALTSAWDRVPDRPGTD